MLKKILKGATDRQRLWIYLALNLGAYQGDIANLKASEVTKFEGRAAIVRRRSKTKHQNEFEGKWVLWDETAKLLKQEMAATKGNEWGLALLTENGRPLLRHDPHCNALSDSYETLQNRTARLRFKQYRKLGATAINRLGGFDIARLYKAGTVEAGDKVYIKDSFEKLTPHLLAWGKQLRRDGVLF